MSSELDSLIRFWKDSLAEHRLLMSPSAVYLVEQTIKRLEANQALDQVADHGLFLARLNNGDWMAGRANHIYHLGITQDHYSDSSISISADLGEAVRKFLKGVIRNDRASSNSN